VYDEMKYSPKYVRTLAKAYQKKLSMLRSKFTDPEPDEFQRHKEEFLKLKVTSRAQIRPIQQKSQDSGKS
jgi:hypothetical protein